MYKERSSYRHPKHEEIVERLTNGASNKSIAAEMKVDKRAVMRIRDILGMKRHPNHGTSMDEKLAKFGTEPDADGHTGWTGRRATSGAPVVRHRGIELPASHVAFQQRTGRLPVGFVRAECGVHDCLTPSHVGDENERRTVRMQERAMYGLDPKPWDICPKGLHPWDTCGRIEPDLSPYCKECTNDRAARARTRAAKKEEATA